MNFLLLFFISIAAGLVAALSGMGGGVILIPIMTALGIDIKQVIAVSSLALVAISSSASLGNIRRHTPNLRIAAFLEIFAVIGAFTGALITLALKKQVLFLLCGIFLLTGSLFFWKQRKLILKLPAQQDVFTQKLGWEGSYYDHVEGKTISYQGKRALLAGVLVFGTGVISPLLGFGGNAFTVLIHNSIIELPPKVSLTMSNLIMGLIALAGVNVYMEGGLLNPNLIVPVIPGVVLGALIGSQLLVHSSNQFVRRFFVIVLIVLSIELILQGLQGIF